MNHRRSLFFPMALIAAGALWLMVNLGYIPAANLWALTHIWPFLLIGLGLALILRNYWAESGIVVSALIVVAAVAAVIYAPQLGWANMPAWHLDWNAGGSVSGSRVMETETRTVSGFDAITIQYPADIVIQQGDAESVSITADDNLLPQLSTEVRSGTLVIQNEERDWGRRVNASQTVKVTITVLDLRNVEFNSAGSVEVAGLVTDSLEIRLNGAGSIHLSEVELGGLNVRLDGAGNIEASGVVDSLETRIDGLGSLQAEGLTAQTASVTVNGLGSATVRVVQSLDVNIDGLGSVNYYGSPTVHQETDGLGSVKRLGN